MAKSSLSRVRSRNLRPAKRARRGLWLGVGVTLLLLAAAGVVRAFSGVRLVADASALGRVEVQPFGGSVVSVRARAADGSTVPLVVSHGRLTPRIRVASGERISVWVVVRRPGWEG